MICFDLFDGHVGLTYWSNSKYNHPETISADVCLWEMFEKNEFEYCNKRIMDTIDNMIPLGCCKGYMGRAWHCIRGQFRAPRWQSYIEGAIWGSYPGDRGTLFFHPTHIWIFSWHSLKFFFFQKINIFRQERHLHVLMNDLRHRPPWNKHWICQIRQFDTVNWYKRITFAFRNQY